MYWLYQVESAILSPTSPGFLAWLKYNSYRSGDLPNLSPGQHPILINIIHLECPPQSVFQSSLQKDGHTHRKVLEKLI